MNRAFRSEDNELGDVFIAPRAPLPPGTANYVTPRGMRLLKEEREALEKERDALQQGDPHDHDRIRRRTLVSGQLAALRERMATARVIDPSGQPTGEVRFGARVRVSITGGPLDGAVKDLRIVGVDEAGLRTEDVSFTSPIARALSGHTPGDTVRISPDPSAPQYEILSVDYDSTDGEE